MNAKTEYRASSVISAIVELCNEGRTISFVRDFGGNTLTIHVDNEHFHAGVPGGSEKQLIADLSRALSDEPE